ncbi:transposon Tf2-9 polyprotein [Trichonephila clavipes]|nr:transposon Tf2-9 polyprotein [Trichonephila clavipes]
MARWSIFLTDSDYEVVHRPAKQMQHVDALSRHPVMLVTNDELTYKIVNAQESDEYIRTIKKLLQEGVKMKNPEDVIMRNLLEKESQEQLFQHRDILRREAKQNILKIQEENRTFNRKQREAHLYKKGDLVAIMRTQFGSKLKLRIKYFGPYQVTKVKPMTDMMWLKLRP